jgi:hypothetical protein
MCVSLWVIGGKECLVAPPTVRLFGAGRRSQVFSRHLV